MQSWSCTTRGTHFSDRNKLAPLPWLECTRSTWRLLETKEWRVDNMNAMLAWLTRALQEAHAKNATCVLGCSPTCQLVGLKSLHKDQPPAQGCKIILEIFFRLWQILAGSRLKILTNACMLDNDRHYRVPNWPDLMDPFFLGVLDWQTLNHYLHDSLSMAITDGHFRQVILGLPKLLQCPICARLFFITRVAFLNLQTTCNLQTCGVPALGLTSFAVHETPWVGCCCLANF